MQQDLWEHGQNSPVPAIFCTKETATEHLKGLEGRIGVIAQHLDSVTVSSSGTLISWNRSDQRVSKEKLEAKFYLSCRNEKLSVQHHVLDSSNIYKTDVPFNKVMGVEIKDGIFTADVFGTPNVETKSVSSRIWQSTSSNKKLSGCSRLVMVLHKNNLPDNLQSQLAKIQPLRSAFHSGLCSSYDNFDPAKGEKPHDRLPILRDPTLVRATQQAILQLHDPLMTNPSSSDVQAIVEAYGGIEKRFRELLKRRMLHSCRSLIATQHEE